MRKDINTNNNINKDDQTVDQSDIRYWHGLLKDGIISKDEFENKKNKLL